MLSRLFATLTLVSSLTLTATPETKEFTERTNTKLVTRLAIAAGLAALAGGLYGQSEKTAAAGIGILTGLGCARLEHYAQKVLSDNDNKLLPIMMPITWQTEMVARNKFLQDVEIPVSVYNSQKGIQQSTLSAHVARGSSWVTYLMYHVVRNSGDTSE